MKFRGLHRRDVRFKKKIAEIQLSRRPKAQKRKPEKEKEEEEEEETEKEEETRRATREEKSSGRNSSVKLEERAK